MKSLRKFSFIAVAIIGLVLAAAPAAALAQDNAKASTLTTLAVSTPAPVFAQIAAPETTTPAPAVTTTPWYLSGGFLGALATVVFGAIAIWQNKEKRTAQKISETLVIGIEAASQIPEVAAYETKIKETIQTKTKAAGVEPLVKKLVDLLT